MNDEERIRDYVRRRAGVRVPDDLQWPSAATKPRRRWTAAPLAAWAGVAAAGAVVIILAAGLLLRPTGPSGPGLPSTSPGMSSSASTFQPPGGTFPAEVAGLPVVTVPHAVELLQAGNLDGQAIAVAGYYRAATLFCPYPGRYIGPLETWCSFSDFTDTAVGAQVCETSGSNGTTCDQSTRTSLAPFFVRETSNASSSFPSASREPLALVLIGHAGDARQWLCTTTTQDECAHAFIVDRVAWAQGHDVPMAAAHPATPESGQPISPRMTLAEVAAAAGLGDSVVAAGAFRAGDIAAVDPRWNFAGDGLLWLVRSIVPGAAASDRATSSETVWLVDDATGTVVDSHPLKLDAAFQPARLWQIANVDGRCCPDNLEAFARVQQSDGKLVYEGLVSNSAGGGGYGSPPLVLPAGTYTITNWIADYAGEVMGAPRDQCSTTITLRPLDNVTSRSDFPAGQACTFESAP
jgi:hypothetical protein